MKTVNILFLLAMANFVLGQKSYIVQIAKGQDASSLISSSRQPDKTIRQLCAEPLNVWEITVKDKSIRDIINEWSPTLTIISIQDNKLLQLRKIPNDSLYQNQWQYKNTGTNSGGTIGADINAEKAWDITTGGTSMNGDEIVVAVVDDGLDIYHEEIVDNLWYNKEEIAGDNIDNDNNGYIDDINGWNVGKNNGIVSAGGGHGTPVAGIVGAKGNNKKGVTGVNWDVKLMAINYGTGNEANAIASYAYAYKMRKLYNETNGARGAFVVATNSSWGIDFAKAEDSPLWCAFYDSLGQVGILSMGATANRNINVDVDGDMPTSCTSEFLIAVTNLTKNNTKEFAAGYGLKSVDLGAYGSSTFTIGSNNRYSSFGGTSGATPHVAGAVALMYSVPCPTLGQLIKSDPAKAALYVKDVLLNTVMNNGSIENLSTTGGRLDLGNAINTLKDQCENCKMPSGIVTYTTSEQSIITWLPTEAKVNIRFRKEGSNTWNFVNDIVADSVSLKDIEFCAAYEFQLKYICNNIESGWGTLKNFKTKGCCEAPKAVSYTQTGNEVLFDNATGMMYQLEIKDATLDVWDTIFYSVDTTVQLENCKAYDIRLSTYCVLQKKYSSSTDKQRIHTSCGLCTDNQYCTPDNLNNNVEWIDSVKLNNFLFFSGQDAMAYGKHFGTITPKLVQGDSAELTIVPGYTGNNYNEDFAAYIDWNQDFHFDTSEMVYASPKSSNKTVSEMIYVPNDAALGLTRMRVIMAFNKNATPPACEGAAEYGEVEDYCVIIDRSSSIYIPSTQNWMLYPNPNNGSFTLESSAGLKVIRYKIINILGETIIDQISDSPQISASLSSGMYRIIVQAGEAWINMPFIVK